MFYYAGHGLELAGENYLLPVDYGITHEADITDRAISLTYVRRCMNLSKDAANLVILDCCREFPNITLQSDATLQAIQEPRHPIQPGARWFAEVVLESFRTALEQAPGTGPPRTRKHSLFTKHLLQYVDQRGRTVQQIFEDVAVAVKKELDSAVDRHLLTADQRQEVWIDSNFVQNIPVYLCEGPDDSPSIQFPPHRAVATESSSSIDSVLATGDEDTLDHAVRIVDTVREGDVRTLISKFRDRMKWCQDHGCSVVAGRLVVVVQGGDGMGKSTVAFRAVKALHALFEAPLRVLVLQCGNSYEDGMTTRDLVCEICDMFGVSLIHVSHLSTDRRCVSSIGCCSVVLPDH